MTGATRTTDGRRTPGERTGDSRSTDAQSDAELDPLHATLQSTGRFVWDNLPSLVIVSVAWFFASLPVVTAGPATVGAYRAVLSLRAGDGLDTDATLKTVRRQFFHATLLGLFPLVVLLVAVNYSLVYLATGQLAAGALAAGGLYVALYVMLVLVPTFVGLAAGRPVDTALWDGYRWTARHVVGTIVLATVTVAVLALASLLTIALVLLFAGVACAFHVEFTTAIDDDFDSSIHQ